MNRTNEITLKENIAHYIMDRNGYIKNTIVIHVVNDRDIILIKFNKEYFN